MDQLTFLPGTGQFFYWTELSALGPAAPVAVSGQLQWSENQPAPASPVGQRLCAAGWPTPARLLGAGEARRVEGVLVELIDALPILAGASALDLSGAAPAVAAWAAAARLGLSLLVRRSLWPQLCPRRPGPDDERICGWEARWAVSKAPATRSRVAQLARSLGTPQTAVLLGKGHPAQQPPDSETACSARALLWRLLDACADRLVREAARRGVYVRIGGWPADAWEQRLVRGLVEDEATFAARDTDPHKLSDELLRFGEEQAMDPPLLIAEVSPPSWRAGESLQEVIGRLVEPTAMLASRLLLGEPAPRTLVPTQKAPAARLQQAVAVTRALLQATAAAGKAPGRRKLAAG